MGVQTPKNVHLGCVTGTYVRVKKKKTLMLYILVYIRVVLEHIKRRRKSKLIFY